MVNLLPQKKMQRSNGRSLSVSGWKWLATFIVDLDWPSDVWFGRCDKEWDANWSRGVTGIFRRTCISGAEYSTHPKKIKNCVLYFQRFSKTYYNLKAGRWPEKLQGQIHLLGYGQRFLFGGEGGGEWGGDFRPGNHDFLHIKLIFVRIVFPQIRQISTPGSRR